MRIEVRGSNFPMSEALEGHVCRKVELASRRFADRIESVVVRLVDLNGPKGGRDKRCRIAARLSISAPRIVVEAIDPDPYLAVTQAAARLDEMITRVVARTRRRAATGSERYWARMDGRVDAVFDGSSPTSDVLPADSDHRSPRGGRHDSDAAGR